LFQDPQIRIYAEDEVHFQQRTSVVRMWWPRGSQPEIPSAPTRAQLGYWGAVDIRSGSLCIEPEEGKFNWITFHGFLEHFLRRKYRSGQQLAMIIDNAGYHKKKELWPFFAENSRRLRMLWLPAYSPNLNPIERVWRFTRRQVTHNRYFESIELLRESLDRFFWHISTPNLLLRSLCAIT
jgi:transposase